MPKQWTIKSVKGGGSALIDCEITENAAATHYEFRAPRVGLGPHPVLSKTPVTTAGTTFAVFRAKLGGPHELDWYLTITSTTAGPHRDGLAGTWSNTSFLAPLDPDPSNDPPDTWVAQANTTLNAEDEASAASA